MDTNKIKQIRLDILNEIKSDFHSIKTLDGVEKIEGSIMAATVSASSIINNNFILSPDYYIQEVQVKVIEEKLNRCDSIPKIQNAIAEMCKDKYVKRGFEKTFLNPNTLKILEKYNEIFNG